MPIDDLVLASVDDNLGNTCAIDINDTIEFNNSVRLSLIIVSFQRQQTMGMIII